MDSENPHRTDRAVSNSKPTFTVPSPPKQIEVDVKTSEEKYPKSLTDEDVFYIVKGRLEQLCDKSFSLSTDDSSESSV